MEDKTLNIGAGHELDQILVHNITNKDHTTLWGGSPYTVKSGESRVLLRFVAVKFAKELARRIVTVMADTNKVPITAFLNRELEFINKILVKVQESHITQVAPNQPKMTQDELNYAEDVGTLSVLEEYGINVKPVIQKADDIAVRPMNEEEIRIANVTSKAKSKKTEVDLTLNEADNDDSNYVAKAKALGLDVPANMSEEGVKELIKASLNL